MPDREGLAGSDRRSLGDIVAKTTVLPADDVVHLTAGLIRQVAALHEQGRVADLTLTSVRETDEGGLELVQPRGRMRLSNQAALDRIQPRVATALKIVGEYRVVSDEQHGTDIEDLRVGASADGAITHPVYLPDLRSWEIELGHHDEITDVFGIGLILTCLACGIDPSDPAQIEHFSINRANLFAIVPRLHPVLAAIILEATMLNRHERTTNLTELAQRLETYRDQPVALDVQRVLAQAQGVPGRRAAVMAHLRDRLFDLSRRNKLIHFRPTQSNVNMTESSMPIVMRIESVRSDQLCTWTGKFTTDVLSGRAIALNQWLRFEDQPQLPSSFDRLIQETRRDRAEYGFSHMRLVVAFLHWHNLREAPDERISSPLLWLPVEISKTKGVRDHYVLRCADTVAEFNPALRHMLAQLYGIELPGSIDLAKTRMDAVHADIMRQIHRSEPGVRLDLQQRPQIQLIHRKAVQRVNRFNRRRNVERQPVSTRTDFSYARDDFRPLGFALFEKFVMPSPLPQRIAAGGSLRSRTDHVVAETEALSYTKGGPEGHKFAWEIDLTQVTLANLNYKKMSLVHDYAELIARPEPQPAFDQVFSIEPRPFAHETPALLPFADQWGVVAADATQDAVVTLARSARSFIVQGPPGTGKSQTITNLIADYAARGKRVLFVCEKRAALDVVFHRLGAAGLDGLTCSIHDSQEDKKAFIVDLREHYERWGKSDDRLAHFKTLRARTVAALQQHIDAIARYDAAVGHSPAGPGLRELARRAAELPVVAAGFAPALREQLPDLPIWNRDFPIAERALRVVRDRSGLASLAVHPFALINSQTVADERPFAAVAGMIDAADSLLQRLDRWLNGASRIATGATTLVDAVTGTGLAQHLVDTGLSRSLDLLDPLSDNSARLDVNFAEIVELENRCLAAAEQAEPWHDPLSPLDTQTALVLAQTKEKSPLRLFSGAWRNLRKTVRARYDFSAHAVAPGVTTVLERLAASHDADAALAVARATLGQRLNSSDVPGLIALRKTLVGDGYRDAPTQALLDQAERTGRGHDMLAVEAQSASAVRQLRQVAGGVLDGMDLTTFDQLAEMLRDMREALDDLPDMLPALREVHQADPAVALALRTIALPLVQIEALIVDEAIARLERTRPDARRFDVDQLIRTTRRASAARERLRAENADVIKAALHHQFHNHVKLSEQSVTQLDTGARALKKSFATGRRELEHEFGKTMRYRSIRDLASGDTGRVVNDLKPIWLMSPLSVSDTLPLQADLFDVVIFDEASQIPIEEAVPALCRSSQVIIVGDEMQLPPTSFFSAALDEDEMQVVAQEGGERISILLDADSLLNQAARNLSATLLAWHYRSRYEALISFSNAAFYSGQLVTIPDRNLQNHLTTPVAVKSDDHVQWSAGVSRLLSAPITVHRIDDGLYDNRVNVPEARYIAGLVRDLLACETGQSIGIVAFSEAQQSEIEAAIDRLAQDDAIFAAAVEREYVREDDGQFNGLFVKNLENVQGDERDIILMSVCYAPGRDGRMVMNFGPINQRGGEKRLNVIFSRARRHMAIVQSIAAEAITNVHNDGARALRGFLAFAQAKSNGSHDHAQAVLTALNPEAARTFGATISPDPVRDAIATALRARGHTVHEQVGSASFRCDIAVVDPDGEGYALGILLDRGDTRDGGTEERYVFRPEILRAFGWRVLDVPVFAWLRGRDMIIDRIETELARSSWDLADSDPLVGVYVPGEAAMPTATHVHAMPEATTQLNPAVTPVASVAGDVTPDFAELRFTDGNSNKFWRIAVNDCEVIVEFGRIGAKGQRVVKTFEDAARASREVTKLTLEKTRKGYQAIA